MTIREQYQDRFDKYLVRISKALEDHVKDHLSDIPRIDRISVRAKSIDSFVGKAEKLLEDGIRKYSDPLNQIQDQIGVRIVTFYTDDVKRVVEIIEGYFRKVESKTVMPISDMEFGYFGEHLILFIPDELIDDEYEQDKIPNFFELQVKTLFQHAWGEAEHDLGYKPGQKLSGDVKRKIAFTSAQAWGADQIFNDLFMAAND